MKKITVNTKLKYEVLIGKDLLKNCAEYITKVISSKKAVIVTDDIVDSLYADTLINNLNDAGFTVSKFVFKNGEPSKCHKTLIDLYEFLSENEITRKDTLIALGGGVVGDLTGFAAATYLRGLNFIQIPTTLLAQIDSSVGGKTAVDIASGKNLVGAFWQPKLVLCDIDTLSTLTDEIFSDGMAEAIKYGVIKNSSLFTEIATYNKGDDLTDIITQCIQIKADIVANDEFDNGERMLLNFGHTLGHGIEKYYHYEKYTHGSAVAIGMYIMTSLCEKYQICSEGEAEKIKAVLEKYKLPYKIDFSIDELISTCLNDKKRQQDTMNIIIPKSIGTSQIFSLSISDFKKFIVGDYLL